MTGTKPRTVWGKIWRWLPEPRATRWLVLGLYGTAVLLGSSALADIPEQVQTAVGHGMTIAMAVLLIIGGLGGMSAVPSGTWRVERGAIWLIVAAATIYSLSIVLAYPLADMGERLIRTGWVAIAVLSLMLRMATIWGADTDPDIPGR